MVATSWWWYTWLPTLVQDKWIGFNSITNIEQVYKVYKMKKNFLNPQFVDAYLPSQPNLLLALILLAVFSIIVFLLFIVYCLIRKFEAIKNDSITSSYLPYSYCSTKSASDSKKISDGNRQQIYLFLGFCCLTIVVWIVLFSTTLIFLACLMDFGSEHEVGESNMNFIAFSNEMSSAITDSTTKKVVIGYNTVTIQDKNFTSNAGVGQQYTEAQILNKYNDIRELGYEFKPLERDATNFLMYLLLLAIFVLYTICLFVVILAFTIGIRERWILGKKLYDFDTYRQTSSSRASMAGRVITAFAGFLFVVSPIVNAIAGILLLHSHAHSVICPFDQTMNQNANIEEYINTNYEMFEALNLVDFLGDLSRDRIEINEDNCAAHIRPIQGIWACLFLLSWTSLVFVALQLVFAKRFLKRRHDKQVPLIPESMAGTYWPYLSPNMDTYASAVDAYSKYSFGTFVYQKY